MSEKSNPIKTNKPGVRTGRPAGGNRPMPPQKPPKKPKGERS